jgi:hypothetical protein
MLSRCLIVIMLFQMGGTVLGKTRKPVVKQHEPSTSFSLGLTQLQSARLKPITQANASVTYSASSNIQLGLSQSFTKNYLINEDGDEFIIKDSSLSLTLSPSQTSGPWSFYSSASTTLPISERSRRLAIQTVSSLSVGADYRPWKIFSAGAGVGGSYHVSRYESEPMGEDGSGAALPQYSLDFDQSARLSILKSGFLGYTFTFSETYYHKIDEEAPNSTDRDITDQAYQIRVYAGYGFSIFTISLGFIQGTLLELPGLRDYLLFDEERSIGYVSLNAGF